MTTIRAVYLGDLQVECEHVQSGMKITTDAPVDNEGQGRSFSPTDLCAASLGACILTVIGIYAGKHGLDLKGAEVEITKKMAVAPRRIGEIDVVVHMPDLSYSDKDRLVLMRVARTCAVHNTLRHNVIQHIDFHWQR